MTATRSTVDGRRRWVRVDEGPVPMFIAFSDQGVSFVRTVESVGGRPEVFLGEHARHFGQPPEAAEAVPEDLARALRDGRETELEFDLANTTAFERDVLAATCTIPRGQTRTYRWVAAEIGRPRAVRAVGNALGRNPVPVLIPCHRVTRSDGTLGHYTFGVHTKQALLDAERLG